MSDAIESPPGVEEGDDPAELSKDADKVDTDGNADDSGSESVCEDTIDGLVFRSFVTLEKIEVRSTNVKICNMIMMDASNSKVKVKLRLLYCHSLQLWPATMGL